jgi:hypothetical protein
MNERERKRLDADPHIRADGYNLLIKNGTLLEKRVRWEDSQNEQKEFMGLMAEKLKRDMKDPETVGNFGKNKKKSKKKDPFEGMEFVGVFGLPIARYAHDYMDEEPEKKPKKKVNK